MLLGVTGSSIRFNWGAWWSSGLSAGLPIVRFGVKIPARAEIWIEISAPPGLPSQFSYIEYIDRTLSVVR